MEDNIKNVDYTLQYNEDDDDLGEASYGESVNANDPNKKNAVEASELLSDIINSNNLNYYSKTYSFEWLVDQIGKGKYSMPKYQRRYVWDSDQVTALIVSLLKKIPIPKLYGYYIEEKDVPQTTLVIDGQQRLTSLFMYYWGIFPSSKTKRINYALHLKEIATNCEIYYGKNFSSEEKKAAKRKLTSEYNLRVDYEFIYKANEIDERQHQINLSYRSKNSHLDDQQKYRLLDSPLDFLIVDGKDYSNAIELFRIYNSAGTPLNPQEIRNGLYQNNHLYKLINEYSDDILLGNSSKYENHNWYLINKNNITGDKREIKKLFQLLAYYFSFSHTFRVNDNNSLDFSNDKSSPLLHLLKGNNYFKFDKYESEIYERHYRRKGSLEKMINNYSQYIAEKGKDKNFLEAEFKTIEDFFTLEFEEKPKAYEGKFNFNNLCMIYLILRENGKLSTPKTIPFEAIYFDTKGYSLNPVGFLYRIMEIKKILMEKGVI